MAARFQRDDRIRKRDDFERVYRARVFAADDMLIVNGDANGLAWSRLGMSVSRKVGGAVVRNRWKRLMREAFRLSRAEIPKGVDLIVRPQKGAVADLEPIRRSLARLAERIAKRVKSSQGSGFRVQENHGEPG